MKAFLAGLLLLLSAFALRAQTLPFDKDFAPTGKFYISIDDKADIFLNGRPFYVANLAANKVPSCSSPELTLHSGDRLVIHLQNFVGQHQFLMTFVSTDKQVAIPFTYQMYKVLPDPDTKDFTEADYAHLSKTAKKEIKRHAKPSYGSHSDWVWGSGDSCLLGVLITPALYQKPPAS